MRLVNLVGALLVAAGVFVMLSAFGVIGVITEFGGDRSDSTGAFLLAGLGLAMIGVGAYLLRRPRKGDPFGRSPDERP